MIKKETDEHINKIPGSPYMKNQKNAHSRIAHSLKTFFVFVLFYGISTSKGHKSPKRHSQKIDIKNVYNP